MAQKQVGFLAAATCTAVVAKAVELPTSFAGALGLAVFGVCVGVTSFLKVEVPKPKQKAKKLSKKEKRELAAANAPPVEEDAEDAAKLAKAAKKRAKDRARKEAKRAAAKAEAANVEKKAAAAEVVAAPVVEKKLTKEQAKKKKQKEKAKAKKAAAKNEVVAPAAAAAPAPTPVVDNWEEVKQKKSKKKVEEVVSEGSSAPAHMVEMHVERKYFGLIIGPGGANLRLLTEATGTEIEMPREGGMQHQVVITGSVEGCAKAQKNLQQLVKKGYCDITQPGTVDTQVFIPDNKRGIVIGSKGANIKMLQEKLSVKINFPEKGSEDNVAIVGESKNVKACEAAIKQLMEQGYCAITHENYMQVHVEVARDMLKNLIGTGGSVIKGLQKTHNVQINIPESSDAVVVVTLLGEPEGIAGCRAQMDVLLAPPAPTVIAPEWTQAASAVHVGVW